MLRARALGAGINLANALEAPLEGTWGVKLTREDFELLKEAGFEHVRLPVRWSAHTAEQAPYTIDPAFFDRVDWAVNTALELGLRVVLDLHHYNELMADPAAHTERLIEIWRQISDHYASSPAGLCFELVNEPYGKMGERKTNEILARLIEAVRVKNPSRMLVVGPTEWNKIETLEALELPDSDDDLLVTVHYYDPYPFTHQGVPWDAERRNLSGLEWPGSLGGSKELRAAFDEAVAWAEQHHRPLYVGEFGAYRTVPMDSRSRWVAAVSGLLRELQIPYAYWELRAGFGAYDSYRAAWRQELLDAILPTHQAPASRLVRGEPDLSSCQPEPLTATADLAITSVRWSKTDRARQDVGLPEPDGTRDLVLKVRVKGPVTALFVLSVDRQGRAFPLGTTVRQWDTVLCDPSNALRNQCTPYAANETWTIAVMKNGELLNPTTIDLPPLGDGDHRLDLHLADPGGVDGAVALLRLYALTPEGRLLASQPRRARL